MFMTVPMKAILIGDCSERFGDSLNDPIAGIMAVGVVDPLEMVNIAERDT